MLQAQLDAYRAAKAGKADPEQESIIDHAIEQVRRSGPGAAYPGPGRSFPDFELPLVGGGMYSLAEARTRGPVVITFYRGLWCPYCNIELSALQAIHADIWDAGGTLVAITPQSEASSRAAMRRMSLSFPILTDHGNTLASAIGIRHDIPAELQALYRGFGVDLDVINGDATWTLPMPSRFVIDRDGIVVVADSNADYRIRPEPADTLAAVQRAARQRR
jgi:peroxiredoxin